MKTFLFANMYRHTRVNRMTSKAKRIVRDLFELLLAESRSQGGRLLTLSLHPWVMGQPHRIKHLEAVLAHISASSEVWQAAPGKIIDAFAAQQGASA